MSNNEDEILDSFFTLLHNIRDVLVINRPDLHKIIKDDAYNLIRDPFGRYFQILIFIGEKQKKKAEEHKISMKEFADRFKIKAGTATGIIDQLVKRNIIKREVSSEDRRKVELSLTAEGEALYRKAIEIQKDEIRSVFDALSPEDIDHLGRILSKINNAFVIEDRTTTE